MRALRFEVFDKAFQFQGMVSAPVEAYVHQRVNAVSTAEFTVESDHPRLGALTTAGARVLVYFRPVDDDPTDWRYLFSGVVHEKQGEGDVHGGSRTFRVEDDTRLLWHMLGWPVPGSPIGSQSAAERYSYYGLAETVVKNLVSNALGHGFSTLTVATNLGRGTPVRVDARMETMADLLFPKVTQAGVGVQIKQVGSGLVLDCYTGSTWPTILTDKSGVVRDGKYALTGPTVTRAIAGDGGEGTARLFRRKINTAVEAEWGVVLEEFVDAGEVPSDDPDWAAALDAKMDEVLSAGGPQSTISAVLAESDTFRYAVAVNLMDLVPLQVADGPPITEVISEVEIGFTRNEGLNVLLRVGPRKDDPQAMLVATLAALRSGMRALQVSR